MDRPGVCQVLEGSGELGEMEETDCEIISGAPTTLAVKGLMIMKILFLWMNNKAERFEQFYCLFNILLTFLYASAL